MNDKQTTIQEMKDLVKKFRKERGWVNTDPKDIALSIVLEAAELLEHFQWVETREVIENAEWRRAVGEEAADVMFLMMELIERLGIDFARAFEEKVRKQATKYPVEKFNPGKSSKDQLVEYRRIKSKTRTDYPFREEGGSDGVK